jgi:hypothetical protein
VANNGLVRIVSLGYQTDLAVRLAEGSAITDRDAYLRISSPSNPGYWWGIFCCWHRGLGG